MNDKDNLKTFFLGLQLLKVGSYDISHNNLPPKVKGHIFRLIYLTNYLLKVDSLKIELF